MINFESMYKLDRNAFKMQSFEEASDNVSYWRNKSASERFAAAWYLICAAYNLPYDGKAKLDRTAFKMRKNG